MIIYGTFCKAPFLINGLGAKGVLCHIMYLEASEFISRRTVGGETELVCRGSVDVTRGLQRIGRNHFRQWRWRN